MRFNALLNHPKFAQINFKSFRLSLGGGMAVQEAVARRWKEVTGVTLVEAYEARQFPLDLPDPVEAIKFAMEQRNLTVKDLVPGSGLQFDDAGEHQLKGVPGRWRLHKVIG